MENQIKKSTFGAKKAGDTLQFGAYGQTKKGKDKTPIDWLVLEKDESSVLVISKFILDSVPYNATKVDMTWKQCSLRQWLNGEFLNKAFGADEQPCIKLCDIAGNGVSGQDDEYSTSDKIFLLNTIESKQYFDKAANRIAQGTEFAKGKKSFTGKLDVYKEHSWWWLRNRGSYGANLAALVDNGGNVNPIGDNIHFLHGGVRPSCRILI